ncbi:MAG: oligosaccharide flippase family protein [Flavobacteriales bacterium]|jgi:O-antigen/teichoic acid export membrane protein|nr:oligosaccharide flippase family protein [Flavobacteriales bacterium]MBT3963676.1 oligosaccharide flippase family protein [Flavobacteriales bacterium]MBT4704778.1 oligosaccharide flippase family protein [Flavobacteriales bacterium]MBT4931639.1 oligosaccharide flippase family protein [Flavobacteriales bacterium]MBT6383736.1 oligosaccharide flippase family protein [Flavobacteriales bacterium]
MGVRRNFSLNLIFLLALNLLIKPFYLFGVEVGVQNAVGAEAYGLYYAMFNFTFLFNVILDLGINNFQKIRMAQDAEAGTDNMKTLLPMKFGLSAVYMAVTVIVALIVGFEARYWFFIGWLMLNHILSMFLLMFRANISGLHLFMRDSVLSVLDRTLMIAAIGYLLWFSDSAFQIEHFVFAQTGAYAIAIIVAIVLTPSVNRVFNFKVDWSSFRDMVSQTWPFALLILIMTAYSKIDGVMIERLADNGLLEAGIYAQAYRLLDAGNNFAFLYAGLLLPMFARLIHLGQTAELTSLLDQAARLLIAPAGVICLIVYGNSDYLMGLLYDEYPIRSAASLDWLMISFVFISISYVFSTLMTAAEKLKWLNILGAITVGINVGLNFWLIPEMGSEGAALASCISLGFMALSQMLYVMYSFRLQTYQWMIRTIGIWLITAALIWGITSVRLEPLYGIIIVAVVSVIGFFAFVSQFSLFMDMIKGKEDDET